VRRVRSYRPGGWVSVCLSHKETHRKPEFSIRCCERALTSPSGTGFLRLQARRLVPSSQVHFRKSPLYPIRCGIQHTNTFGRRL
jgi:hypothetical protein